MSRLVIIGGNSFIAKNFLKNFNNKITNLEIININSNIDNSSQKYINFNEKIDWSKHIFKNDIIIFFSSPSHTNIKKIAIKNFINNFRYFLTSISKLQINKFIFISSQKILGESNPQNKLFCYSAPNPQTNYSKYKLECENIILKNYKKFNLNYIILRPPVVIGKGMKGNINIIAKFLKLRIPLPLKYFKSRRNYISIYNLNLIINKCIMNENLNNKIYTLNDGNEYSLKEIILKTASSLGVPVINFNNIFYFYAIFWITKILNFNEKIFSNFYVDCSIDLNKIDVDLKNDLEQTLIDSFK